MKSRLLGAISAGIFGFLSTATPAALVDNGGGLIYDTVLDITWAQPHAEKIWDWDNANTWAAGLTLGGVSGWRLPYISVAAGAGPFTGSPVDCSTASEAACRDNELGYMFFQNLSGTPSSPLFPTLQPNVYWSGTEYDSVYAWWSALFGPGGDGLNPKSVNYYSWAVHAGNVVPVPAAVWLFGSGLLGLVGIARRKKPA